MSVYEQLKEQKKCIICRKQDERTLSGKVLCSNCARKGVERQRKKRAECREKHKCAWCGAPTDRKANGNYYMFCKKCRIKDSEIRRERRNSK